VKEVKDAAMPRPGAGRAALFSSAPLRVVLCCQLGPGSGAAVVLVAALGPAGAAVVVLCPSWWPVVGFQLVGGGGVALAPARALVGAARALGAGGV